MSFNGIYVWDAKNGLPTSYSDAHDMETQVARAAPKEINHAFMAVAQAVERFVKEAQEYYDDEMLNIYSNITESMADYIDPVLSFEHAPEELVQELSGVIVKAAQDNNLVVLHQEIAVAFLPDGRALTDIDTDIWDDFAEDTLASWQNKLVALKKENESREQLPSTSAPLKKLVNQIVRARLKEAGITKIKKPYPTTFAVDTGRIQLSLNILPEIDHLYGIEEGVLRVELFNFLNIYLNDFYSVYKETNNTIKSNDSAIPRQRISYEQTTTPLVFFKDDYSVKDYGMNPKFCIRVYDLSEFEAEVHRCVDMLLYFYNACNSLAKLYDTLVANKNSKELGLHKYNYHNYIPKPHILLVMAKLTKQSDYNKLIPYYRKEYIDYKMKEYQHKKQSYERSEQERSEQWSDYKKSKFNEASDPRASFEYMIDQIITYLDTLDVDSILDAPPNKALGF